MTHPKTKSLLFIIILLVCALGAAIVFRLPIMHYFSHSADATEKAVYYCPMHPTYTADRPGDCPICNMKLVKREPEAKTESATGHEGHAGHGDAIAAVRTFTLEELLKLKPGEICLLHQCKGSGCKMVITEESARLGKCPGCGEDLGIILKDLAPAGYANVPLPADKQALLGVKTAEAKKIALTKEIRTVGRIAYDPELYQAQEEYIQAVEAAKKAKTGSLAITQEQSAKLVDSARLRLSLLGLSDELIDAVEAAGKPDRSLLRGESGGTVWLYAPIYEYEMPLIKIGQKVEAEVSAIPAEKFEGKIRSIDPVLDKMSRSVRIRAVLSNPTGLLKPEMYANVNISIALGPVLAVPENAVFGTGEKNIVFVVKPGGIFEPREVVLGVKSDQWYEIKSGLGEGEQVVASSNFLIDSESRLRGALEGMSGSGHHHGQ